MATYAGNPEGCKHFVLACGLYLGDCADLTEWQKIIFTIQHLTAMDRAAASWGTGANITATYEQFIQELRGVFDHLDNGKLGEQHLM